MQFRKTLLTGAMIAATGFLLPTVAAAQAPAVPDFTQLGFPAVVASQSLAAGASGTVQYGPISVSIPAGAFSSPVQFELLEGPFSSFQSNAPAGQTVIADFAFKVVDTATNQLVGSFQKPVALTLVSSSVGSSSVYYNVTPTGALVENPVPAQISGTTLTHAIPVAMVGWAITSPTSTVQSAPDFTGLGFPSVVASQKIAAGASGTITYGPISVQVPSGAFPTAVDFELLEGPFSSFQAKAPAGQTVIADFAFKVVDQATGQLIGSFQKPVALTLVSSSVGSSSVYYNVTPTGALVQNPVPAQISGTTLTHPIPVAMVGWAITSPAATVASVPDLSRSGFPDVVASIHLAAMAQGSVHYGPLTVEIPAGAFSTAVTFELLHAPIASVQDAAPAGQTVISDFALRVVDTATGSLVGQFQKPVLLTLRSGAVTRASIYYNITPSGAFVPNPLPAKISGTTLTHPIPVAVVGWAVTSPSRTVPAATSPTTGLPVLPIVGVGLILIGSGILLLRRARTSQA